MTEQSPFETHLSASYKRGACPSPFTHLGQSHSQRCGDYVRLELIVDEDIIVEAWHTAAGCLVCQTGGSLTCEFAEGTSIDRIRRQSPQSHLALFGVQLTPFRQQCALVSFFALRDAFDSDL